MKQHCSTGSGEDFFKELHSPHQIYCSFRLFSAVSCSNNENREKFENQSAGYCHSKTFQLLIGMILLTYDFRLYKLDRSLVA